MKLPGEEKQEFIIREYCIQNFHLGRYIVKYTIGAVKRDFGTNMNIYPASITPPLGEFSDILGSGQFLGFKILNFNILGGFH